MAGLGDAVRAFIVVADRIAGADSTLTTADALGLAQRSRPASATVTLLVGGSAALASFALVPLDSRRLLAVAAGVDVVNTMIMIGSVTSTRSC